MYRDGVSRWTTGTITGRGGFRGGGGVTPPKLEFLVGI